MKIYIDTKRNVYHKVKYCPNIPRKALTKDIDETRHEKGAPILTKGGIFLQPCATCFYDEVVEYESKNHAGNSCEAMGMD